MITEVVIGAALIAATGALLNEATRRATRWWATRGRVCWLCQDMGGIAIHYEWSKRRGTDRPPLWTAHALDTGDDHPVHDCPACGRRTRGRR